MIHAELTRNILSALENPKNVQSVMIASGIVSSRAICVVGLKISGKRAQ